MNSKFSVVYLAFIALLTLSQAAVVEAQTLPPEVVEAKPKMYQILGRPKKGSKFKHVEAEFPVPFDRSYSQLTEEQQDIYRKVHTWLTSNKLADDHTPPYPAKGLRAIYKPIIKKNKLVAINKTVFFIVDVKETGEVKQVRIYKSPNNEFTEFLNTLAFVTKFEPATCAGEPCAGEFPFELDLRYVHRNSNITGNVGSDSWQQTQPQ